MTQGKHISVVIPNYNGLDLLKKNFSAVLDCLRDGDEVVVVDDASTDASVSWLTKKYSLKKQSQMKLEGQYKNSSRTLSLRVLVNKTNLRFAKSVNKGVSATSHDLIFLLNNDVSPYKDCLQYLLPYFHSKDVFAVAPLEHEGSKKSGKNVLWFEKGLFVHSKAKDLIAGKTAWVSGGSGLFDKSKWQELHGFDGDFSPAYWEDIDLSFRAKMKGWKVLFEPKSQVNHNHETTNRSTFGVKKIYHMSWTNADKFTWKNGTLSQKIRFIIWKPFWWYRRKKHLNHL